MLRRQSLAPASETRNLGSRSQVAETIVTLASRHDSGAFIEPIRSVDNEMAKENTTFIVQVMRSDC